MRTLFRVVGVCVILLGAMVSTAGNATACDPIPLYDLQPDLLVGDFNAPDSDLNTDYRQWRNRTFSPVDEATIEVRGAYVFESVYWIDGDDAVTGGSVNVLREVWGQVPASPSAELVEPIERASASASCGPSRVGSPVGTRLYWVVTDQGVLPLGNGDAAMATLVAAFGAPTVADRDLDFETQLINQLQDINTGSSVLPVVLGGLGLVALVSAGAFFRWSRALRIDPAGVR